MHGVALITLLAFVAQSYGDEALKNLEDQIEHLEDSYHLEHGDGEGVAANDMDKFVDNLVDELSDKWDAKNEEGEESDETGETEELDESDETEELDESDETEELSAKMDKLEHGLNKMADRLLKTSSSNSADLDTTTLGKSSPDSSSGKESLPSSQEEQKSMINDILKLNGGMPTMKAMKVMKAKLPMKLAMKVMKAMKAMKKKKRVSKLAKGKLAKSIVFRGLKEKTASGLKKADLFKNKRGKVVTKKSSAAGKKAYKNIQGWVAAVVKARKALGLKGFVAIKKGTPLYTKTKSFYR